MKQISYEKIWKTIRETFEVERLFLNTVLSIVLLLHVSIIKIGIVAQKEITGGSVFQIWVWACLLMFMVLIACLSLFYLEKLFMFAGGILMLMILFPVEFYEPDIAVFIVITAIIGYLGCIIGNEIISRKEKK